MQNRELRLKTGEWLLPREHMNFTTWACVACDQFTSQPEYWAEARALVGDLPSTLKMILPECELDKAAERIPEIHANMKRYLATDILHPAVADGFILTERNTSSGARVGLVVLLDLEGYDYRAGSTSLIRPTEGTIVERIPPRLAVRRGAAMELSHVLLLLDDPMLSVVEPLYEKRFSLEKLYDFPLMMNGGHLAGYVVTSPQDVSAVAEALSTLKAQLTDEHPLLYAVGDGNHSLATAKAYWEEIKGSLSPAEQEEHPARYAMVELTNLHDDALQFEPIHRVLFGFDGDDLLQELNAYALAQGWSLAGGEGAQEIDCVYEGKEVVIAVSGSGQTLAVGTLQTLLDAWLKQHSGVRLDYVHGEAAVRTLAQGEKTVGFLLPQIDKHDVFLAVARDGALPRKTFSIGEAHEKRYYMEARKLNENR